MNGSPVPPQGIPNLAVVPITGVIEHWQVAPQPLAVTKPEVALPSLYALAVDPQVAGVVILVHSPGGDVDGGLAIAEAIASLGKPTASLVLAAAHSIALAIAVAADKVFMAPTASIFVHPLQWTGQIRGYAQSLESIQALQDRVNRFVLRKRLGLKEERLKELSQRVNDMTGEPGTMLKAEEAIREGIADAVGGIRDVVQDLLARVGYTK